MSVNPFESPRSAGSVPASDLESADPFTRFGARMVDGLAAAAAFVPSVALILSLPVDPEDSGALALEMLPSAGLYLGLVGYQWYGTATAGQTIGKRMLGIRIVTEDGDTPGFFAGVVMREWALRIVGAVLNAATGLVGSLVALADALMVFTDEGRTLHDRIAGTRVVTDRSALDPE